MDWPTARLALSRLIAAIVTQEAYASGSFPAALTAMTIGDPVASWIWGVVFLDATPGRGLTALMPFTIPVLLLVVGVALLAYSPTLNDIASAGGRVGLSAARG